MPWLRLEFTPEGSLALKVSRRGPAGLTAARIVRARSGAMVVPWTFATAIDVDQCAFRRSLPNALNLPICKGADMPESIKVWDLFVRIGHWTIVAGFAIAYLSEDLPSLHVWAGSIVGAAVLIRIIWGFVGPRRARFSDFVHAPAAVHLSHRSRSFSSKAIPWS